MAYSAPPTLTTGAVITDTRWNQDTVYNMQFLHNPPSCQAGQTVSQSLPSSYAIVEYDTENWDTDQMWSTALPKTILINTPGIYLLTAGIEISYTASLNSAYGGFVIQNDAVICTIFDYRFVAGTTKTRKNWHIIRRFQGFEHAQVWWSHNSASVGTTDVSNDNNKFGAHWLGGGD